jgi:coenzyme F420-reducing hydrogenase alpha subunit
MTFCPDGPLLSHHKYSPKYDPKKGSSIGVEARAHLRRPHIRTSDTSSQTCLNQTHAAVGRVSCLAGSKERLAGSKAQIGSQAHKFKSNHKSNHPTMTKLAKLRQALEALEEIMEALELN